MAQRNVRWTNVRIYKRQGGNRWRIKRQPLVPCSSVSVVRRCRGPTLEFFDAPWKFRATLTGTISTEMSGEFFPSRCRGTFCSTPTPCPFRGKKKNRSHPAEAGGEKSCWKVTGRGQRAVLTRPQPLPRGARETRKNRATTETPILLENLSIEKRERSRIEGKGEQRGKRTNLPLALEQELLPGCFGGETYGILEGARALP